MLGRQAKAERRTRKTQRGQSKAAISSGLGIVMLLSAILGGVSGAPASATTMGPTPAWLDFGACADRQITYAVGNQSMRPATRCMTDAEVAQTSWGASPTVYVDGVSGGKVCSILVWVEGNRTTWIGAPCSDHVAGDTPPSAQSACSTLDLSESTRWDICKNQETSSSANTACVKTECIMAIVSELLANPCGSSKLHPSLYCQLLLLILAGVEQILNDPCSGGVNTNSRASTSCIAPCPAGQSGEVVDGIKVCVDLNGVIQQVQSYIASQIERYCPGGASTKDGTSCGRDTNPCSKAPNGQCVNDCPNRADTGASVDGVAVCINLQTWLDFVYARVETIVNGVCPSGIKDYCGLMIETPCDATESNSCTKSCSDPKKTGIVVIGTSICMDVNAVIEHYCPGGVTTKTACGKPVNPCPNQQTWNCAKRCPGEDKGYVVLGTPACVKVAQCPPGQTGTPPACVNATQPCPKNQTGTPPACIAADDWIKAIQEITKSDCAGNPCQNAIQQVEMNWPEGQAFAGSNTLLSTQTSITAAPISTFDAYVDAANALAKTGSTKRCGQSETNQACTLLVIPGFAGRTSPEGEGGLSLNWMTTYMSPIFQDAGYDTHMLSIYGGECGADLHTEDASKPGVDGHKQWRVDNWWDYEKDHPGRFTGCDVVSDSGVHDRNTRIEHLAYHLAWYISNTYGNTPIDIVAYSMGGLVLRYALHEVSIGNDVFPSRRSMNVETVIDYATPHNGARYACAADFYREIREMCEWNGLLNYLRSTAQSPKVPLTRWVLFGSADDEYISKYSAVDMDGAEVLVYWYRPFNARYGNNDDHDGVSCSNLGHGGYFGERAGKRQPDPCFLWDNSKTRNLFDGRPVEFIYSGLPALVMGMQEAVR